LFVTDQKSSVWPTNAYIDTLARSSPANSGARSASPELFLKKLVSDVLDRIDQFDDFDPRQHYQLTVNTGR